MAKLSESQSRFPDARDDLVASTRQPDTPQTLSPSYRLAFSDAEFLTRDELRPVRLQLELLKPEMAMAERGIRSTVVMFGGARIPDPGPQGASRARPRSQPCRATTTRPGSSRASSRCARSPRATART
jgi:hypothetical protein